MEGVLSEQDGNPNRRGSLVMCPEKEALPGSRGCGFSWFGWNFWYFNEKFCSPSRIRSSAELLMLSEKKDAYGTPAGWDFPHPGRQGYVWGGRGIDQFLDYPQADPHGDPIPRADGSLPIPATSSLVHCQDGTRFRLVRVLDQASPFLRYLDDVGLPLGVEGRVVENRPEAGVVTVQASDRETTLGRESAEKLLITVLDDH